MKLGLHTISVWFGLLMILLVVSGAFVFSFSDFMIDRLNGPKRIFFVVILLAYAIYRGFRLFSVLKQSQNDD